MKIDKLNDSILRDYISRTGQMYEDYGFPRILGQMGALLYLYEGPLSLDEIAEYLNVSKGSVSSNGRALLRMKYIRIIKKPGERKDYYEFSGNLWTSVSGAVESFIHTQVEDFKDFNTKYSSVLQDEMKKENSDSKALKYTFKQIKDLDHLFKFLSWLSSVIKLVKKTPVPKISKLLSRFFRD